MINEFFLLLHVPHAGYATVRVFMAEGALCLEVDSICGVPGYRDNQLIALNPGCVLALGRHLIPYRAKAGAPISACPKKDIQPAFLRGIVLGYFSDSIDAFSTMVDHQYESFSPEILKENRDLHTCQTFNLLHGHQHFIPDDREENDVLARLPAALDTVLYPV